METIGIGILAFHGVADLAACLESVMVHTLHPYECVVFDNSEDAEVLTWLMEAAPWVTPMRSPHNVGCARPHNSMLEHFARRGFRHAVILDQDVTLTGPAWDADMLEVFRRYAGSAVVGWHLATKQMSPGYRPDATGRVPEIPGMCNMYSIEAMLGGVDPNTRGWCPDYFTFRFDTDACYCAAVNSWATRVVWPDTDKVAHNRPHTGIARHPRFHASQTASRAIFSERAARFGFPRTLG